MIWPSTAAMTIIDLTIIGVVTLVIVLSVSRGLLDKGRSPRIGRAMLLGGIGVTGLFYFVDLMSMTVFPEIFGDMAAMRFMETLHLDLRWVTTLVSVGLISVGIVVVATQRRELEDAIADSERRVDFAEQSIVRSESRFRSLVENTPDSVFCYEFVPPMPTRLPLETQMERIADGTLVECNRVFAVVLGGTHPSDVLGMRLGQLDSSIDREAYARFCRALMDGDYRLVDYDYLYRTPEGEEQALQTSVTGVVVDGRLVRLWGSEKNVLDLKITKDQLRERQGFQGFLAETSSSLIVARDKELESVLEERLKKSCIYFGCDRVSLVWFDRENQEAELLFYWNEHGGRPWVSTTLENYPWVADRVLQGEAVRIGRIDELPDDAGVDRQNLERLGLLSVLVLPLIVSGKVVGICSYGNVFEHRYFSDEELVVLRMLAELFGNIVLRVRSRMALDRVLAELRQASDRLEAENVYLRDEIQSAHGFHELVGQSEGLLRCLRQVQQVAATRTAVLILGETGTGKELIARAIHGRSDRRQRPLVKVNCAALPASLIESELFGHEKGAFTGASTRKRGRFDLADGGTLFLDEIGDLPLELQGKLLRVLQEGEFERVGGSETIKVDVRLIAATNRHLSEAVDQGDFRADLYYRINTFPITIPALRERRDDIPLLAEHFAGKHAQQLGREISAISAGMMDHLLDYHWPGNVRELDGVIQRAIISTNESVLRLVEPLDAQLPQQPELLGSTDLRDVERRHIVGVLDEANWVIGGAAGAAEQLGMPASTLRSKMKKLGIQRPN